LLKCDSYVLAAVAIKTEAVDAVDGLVFLLKNELPRAIDAQSSNRWRKRKGLSDVHRMSIRVRLS